MHFGTVFRHSGSAILERPSASCNPNERLTKMTNVTSQLIQAESEHISKLKSIFETYHSDDREGFQVILALAIQNGVPRQKIKDEFGISAGTLCRWESGETAPISVSRKTIVAHLSGLIKPAEAVMLKAS